MLEHYLFSRFEVLALRAPVPENEGQFLQDVYKPAYHYGGPGKFAFSLTMQTDLQALTDYEIYARQISQSWSAHMVGHGDFLLEKSPPNLTKIWWLRRVFSGAIFIIFTRDPRAVSAATQKWSKTGVAELMMHWATAHALAKNDILDDTIVMTYEEFCSSPDEIIRRSGVERLLPRRITPLPTNERFREIENTNQKYLNMLDGQTFLGGNWGEFGYRF